MIQNFVDFLSTKILFSIDTSLEFRVEAEVHVIFLEIDVLA